ncbi:FecR family protein [Chitinophaga lutea]
MEKDYKAFEQDDFLDDGHFLAWVKHNDPAAAAFFEAYRRSGAANLGEMEKAVATLQAILSLDRITAPPGVKAAVLEQIRTEMKPALRPVKGGWRQWARVAAVALPLLAASAWWLLRDNGDRQIASAFGQHRNLVLPDSSTVLLNANSSLRYGSFSEGRREVWLQGEALFDVRPRYRRHPEPFTVHAGQVKVEVLGTVFNIRHRPGKTQVFLQEGRIRVTAANAAPIVLQPGQQVTFDSAANKVSYMPGDADVSLAWTSRKMELRHTSVRDIIQTLHDQYGFKVVLEDTSIASRRIDGTLPLNKPGNVLFELSVILNVNIDRKNDTLIFRGGGQRGY